ncbi:MAG: hypothetical protein N3G78_04345 [Desulfobacterota bacterium]|nr:hypothetical protein [Thermodesulfobacteriota bacterium]
MMENTKRRNWGFWGFVLFILLAGCSNTPNTLDRTLSGPQVVVHPGSIRLGVAKLMDTVIVFEGSGFKPGDSIFISLHGPQETKAIVAEANIQPDGTFRAELGKSPIAKLTKAMEILKADIVPNERFEPVVVISQPPIPTGDYKVRVNSMLSPLSAETTLKVKGPTVIDRLMDWIGKLTGKIEEKKGS